jgi:hypothetical protein
MNYRAKHHRSAFTLVELLAESWPPRADFHERARRAKTFAARVAVEAAMHAAMVAGGRSYPPDQLPSQCPDAEERVRDQDMAKLIAYLQTVARPR